MALAAHPGKIYLKASASAPSGGDEVKGINKNSFKINGEQLDVTDFKDTTAWRLFIQGLKNGTLSFDGFVEPTDAPQTLIRSSLLTYADLWCTLEMNPSGATGLKGFFMQVLVESYDQSADVGGLVTFSCSLRITGAAAVDS